jgi:8-oxo-dGTP pyrophosphatase MutT (NUDIX family)
MAHIHELYDFTVSFFILHPTERKFCLHFHHKLNFWNQLGGHIELNEDPMQALERELAEEAGLQKGQYEIIETTSGPAPRSARTIPNPFSVIIYNYGDTPHKHIDMPYIVKSKTAVLAPAEGESAKIGWFSIEEIHEMFDSGVLDGSVLDICEWVYANYM